jgi:alpha,alpha-trehalase
MPASTHFSIESLSPLYEAVQTSEIFADSKFFVDCIPRSSSTEILTHYETEKNQPGFDLKNFVQARFSFPAETDNGYSSANKSLKEHLSGLWDVLTRKPDQQTGTLIPLPYPYIVPGGRFREVYYWDSYFTMLGLQVSKRVDIIQNMVDNFAYLIDEIGFIPNGNRTYYLGRSQPPFFALMLTVLMEEKGDKILLKYQSQLEKEYRFWMDGSTKVSINNPAHRRVILMEDGSIMNRYWDDRDTPRPEAFLEDTHIAKKSGKDVALVYRHIRAAAESGWDFSSRWFRDGTHMETIETTDLVPVDLNCLLLFMETLLASIYQQQDEAAYKTMLQQINQRKKAIHTYCWNEEKGFFFDYHYIDQEQTDTYTLASAYPLFCNCATKEQSNKVAACIEEKFLKAGGLITTLNNTGQQWDFPNGWAPLQWITYKGLQNYGHNTLAEKIRQNWMRNNEKVYAATGKMMEKYNVTDTESLAGGGEYPNQDGFGWTNGVYLKFLSEDDTNFDRP